MTQTEVNVKKNDAPKHQKRYENQLQMEPEDPKWSQNAFEIERKSKKMRWLTQNGYQMPPKTPLPARGHRFLVVLGFSLGPQKSRKIDIFANKPSQGTLLHRILARMSFFSIFRSICSRFYITTWSKKTCFFQGPVAFLPTWRLLRNTVFYRSKCTFDFFRFLSCLGNNH